MGQIAGPALKKKRCGWARMRPNHANVAGPRHLLLAECRTRGRGHLLVCILEKKSRELSDERGI